MIDECVVCALECLLMALVLMKQHCLCVVLMKLRVASVFEGLCKPV